MPRRTKPDPLALAVGRRIKQLRHDAGLTLEKLAYESKLESKGHLSNLERGLVRPTVNTLAHLAERLGVLLLDLVTFPDDDVRQRLVDGTRFLDTRALQDLVRNLGAATLRAAEPSSSTYRRKRRPPARS